MAVVWIVAPCSLVDTENSYEKKYKVRMKI